MQHTLLGASGVLHSALDGKVYIKSVNVVVPSSWRESKCSEAIRPPKGDTPYRRADVWVSGPHPIHDERPFTQQSRGCGQSGDFISLPFQFLLAAAKSAKWDNETLGSPSAVSAARAFVHEWAKLRYGIFDEFGYGRDLFYPSHFFYRGRILPTGSTNRPLRGSWVNPSGTECEPVKDDCTFRPAGDNSGVTCSLGYAHSLANVTRFCSDQDLSTLPMPPTKHNVLCEGRSAFDVIASHEDFKRIDPNRSRSRAKSLVPEVNVFREPAPQYVLVVETSASMDEGWKWINKAAQKFIRYDLPVNSKLAIVTFNNNSKVEHPMVEVTGNDARARLADTIPDRYHLSKNAKRCVLCALQKVVHVVVAQEQLAGTHLILLTRGSRDTLTSATDEQIIRNYVLDYNLRISAILLPDGQESVRDPFLSFYDEIAQDMGGKTHVVNADKVMDFYMGVNAAFADILGSDARYPTETPVEVHNQVYGGPFSDPVIVGNFLIDSTLGRDTLFGIYVEDEEEHRIRSVSFTDSKGTKYGPYTRMSSTFDLVNFKTINFPRERAPPFNAVSNFPRPHFYLGRRAEVNGPSLVHFLEEWVTLGAITNFD